MKEKENEKEKINRVLSLRLSDRLFEKAQKQAKELNYSCPSAWLRDVIDGKAGTKPQSKFTPHDPTIDRLLADVERAMECFENLSERAQVPQISSEVRQEIEAEFWHFKAFCARKIETIYYYWRDNYFYPNLNKQSHDNRSKSQ